MLELEAARLADSIDDESLLVWPGLKRKSGEWVLFGEDFDYGKHFTCASGEELQEWLRKHPRSVL